MTQRNTWWQGLFGSTSTRKSCARALELKRLETRTTPTVNFAAPVCEDQP